METYDILIAVGAVVDTWLLSMVWLRVRPSRTRTRVASLAVGFILMNLSYLGLRYGSPGPGIETLALFAALLAHALVPVFVFGLPSVGRQSLGHAALSVLALVPVVTILASLNGWSLQAGYRSGPLAVFLIACLAIALVRAVQLMISGPLLSSEAYWVIVGIVALINAGPGYAYELQVFRFPSVGASNVATPIALFAFAIVTCHMKPYITISRWRRPSWYRPIPPSDGSAMVLDEVRPKYLDIVARHEARLGRPVLVLNRGRTVEDPSPKGIAEAHLMPERRAAIRVLGTASEFLARQPGGLVVMKGLAAVAALCGWPRALQLVRTLHHMCRQGNSTLLLTTSCLSPSEKVEVKALGFHWLPLPDPVEEIEAILSQTFGSGAAFLVDGFAKFHGRSKALITTDDIPALAAFLLATVGQLSEAVGDPDLTDGVRFQLAAVVARLRAFQALTLKDLSKGEWPSRVYAVPRRGLLVRAAELNPSSTEHAFAGTQGTAPRMPIYERARPAT